VEPFPFETIEPGAPPPRWVAYLISLIVTLAVFGAVGYVLWRFRPEPEAAALDALSREAEAGLAALQGGEAWQDTISRCYFEMSRIVAQAFGLERKPWLTPREFTVHLTALGLPQDAVASLTHLFEAARYGDEAPATGASEQAETSLKAIVTACRPATARSEPAEAGAV
jgi:hypothetical protein